MSGFEKSKICVVGAGSWGTTLANLLAGKGMEVDLWVREQDVLNEIRTKGTNSTFLPGIKLEKNLRAVDTFEEAVFEKKIVLIVVPSHVFREVLVHIKTFIKPEMSIMIGTKGIENDTLMIMSQVAESVLSSDWLSKISCLAGPSFAREVCKKYPTAVTVACKNGKHAKELQETLHTDFLRVYISNDLMGCQLGGALKNVIAIAAGTSDGLKFGHNARAALITRGLAEITRLAVAMGSNPYTLAGLAGMGDLVLTCTGDLSRNRSVGLKIGEGSGIDEITSGMNMVAEGIKTAKSAYELGKKMGVEMPIASQVYYMLYEGKNPKEAVKELMSRELKSEIEHEL
ncbi:MAG: NAD(P)-dependent glycerol-3-phosphate dehydrogenase [Deltaproteobacteria bacterium]|nr:NAD(P)-dependent glycerol-3-phosphate dehydrogenase [Deltaproteobacteria bacterium]